MCVLSLSPGEPGHSWQTSDNYKQDMQELPPSKFLEITNLLLANPNLNSSHLFRADILFDSEGILPTPAEKERSLGAFRSDSEERDCPMEEEGDSGHHQYSLDETSKPRFIEQKDLDDLRPGLLLQRTVIRRLIPRKPQLDRALEQSCLIYCSDPSVDETKEQTWSVVYHPHVANEESMPWYHPPVKALAYLYYQSDSGSSLSVYYLPFITTLQPVPPRLDRTMLSLLQTFVRLAKHPSRQEISTESGDSSSSDLTERSLALSDLKDTIIPQHHVQDTYTRLKQIYAADLIMRWVEKTEPFKHVFEDLAIAAFLIELWKQLYSPEDFPGFVDIACGNGVLVYVLRKEGYRGCGFDARRRKTWDILGLADEDLSEQICVPKPFLDVLRPEEEDQFAGMNIHDGVFPRGSFLISNHADELTPWTPLLAVLSSPDEPLSFIAIPCCSHALSGARHRYSPKEARASSSPSANGQDLPSNGDLKAMRAAKARANSHGDDKSMYSCLTRKVIALAEELGTDVELTLMRIPSTRNIGIVGNRRRFAKGEVESLRTGVEGMKLNGKSQPDSPSSKLERLLERECAASGGIEGAAKIWFEGARKLQASKGRSKSNLWKAENG